MKVERAKFTGKTLVILMLSSLLWLGIWEGLVFVGILKGAVLPAPHVILVKMVSGAFLNDFAADAISQTFAWTALAWMVGTLLAIVLVLVAISCPIIRVSLTVPLLAGRTLPSVVAVPLFAAVIGIGRGAGFLCALYLCICYSLPTLEDSMKTTMASRRVLREALGLKGWRSVLFITIPGIGRAVRATGIQSFGIALVVTVAAEMILPLRNTAGDKVADLAWLLRMVEVYALVGWLVICSMIFNVATHIVPHLCTVPAKILVSRLGRKLREEDK